MRYTADLLLAIMFGILITISPPSLKLIKKYDNDIIWNTDYDKLVKHLQPPRVSKR